MGTQHSGSEGEKGDPQGKEGATASVVPSGACGVALIERKRRCHLRQAGGATSGRVSPQARTYGSVQAKCQQL